MRFFILITLCLFGAALPALAQEFTDEEPVTAINKDIYFEIEAGASMMLVPQSGFKANYNDTDYNVGWRAATSLTYNRFRFEYGVIGHQFKKGLPRISSYQNQAVSDSTSEMSFVQRETLFLWLKNEDHRVSFIGGGPVTVSMDETMKLDYANGQSATIKGTSTGNGFKLVVGGKDRGNFMKNTFSYTSTKMTSISGKKFYMQGYAFTVQVSFGGP